MIECICSHIKMHHYESWVEAMAKCRGKCAVMGCGCQKFKPDNLKYLEECYEKQNLG